MCASWDGTERRLGSERRKTQMSIGRAQDRRKMCHPYEEGHTCAYCESVKAGLNNQARGRRYRLFKSLGVLA